MLSTIERRQQIVQQVQSLGKVMVDALARQFAVSTVTIRADLNELDESGLLVRCRGGALASTKLARELSVQERYNRHLPTKQKIGKAAAKLIHSGDSLILDAGTTTEQVARCLADYDDLVVMTNGLNIASALARAEGVELLITGGSLRRKSLSFYGRPAEHSLRGLQFDKLILGVDGFSVGTGITTYFEPEAVLNRLMCTICAEIIAVTDSSKFDRRGFYIICAHDRISTLVTDSGLPSDCAEALKSAGVELVIVDA